MLDLKKNIVDKMLHKSVEDKRKLASLLKSPNFDMFIVCVILFDAIVLGFMASDVVFFDYKPLLFLLDRLCLAIFVMEMLLKLFVFRKEFFKNGWNIFDFIIVAISSVPYASSLIVLRTFRLFRLFKFLDHCPCLKNMVDTAIKLLPNFLSFLVVLAVIFYSFAVIGVSLYGDIFADFATLGDTLFLLLQVFTLDGWAATIARPVMSVFPDAWMYFASFILLSFLAVVSFVVNALSTLVDVHKK